MHNKGCVEDPSVSRDVEKTLPPDSTQLTFAWSELTVVTKAVDGAKCCGLIKGEGTEARTLLDNVSGVARPGEVLAIMGPSGSGKSTLLNTLLFRHSEGLKISGSRLVNTGTVTQLVSPTNLTSVSAYVQQEDLFIPSLTVREHLIFHAKLRLEAGLTSREREDRVEAVMSQVGLSKVANVLIGDEKLKGLSGGEKKRLSFASEFLTNPSILFCDEPTSGLDSYMAASIMQLLMEFSRLGKTVICTIHQPSSQIFSRFDKLLLLAEGKTAFLGEAARAKQFFASLSFPCPEDYNPADHLVQVLSVVPGEEEESREKIDLICQNFQQSQAGTEIRADIKALESQTSDEDQILDQTPYKASWIKQVLALTCRQALSVAKNPMMLKVKVITAVVVGLILGTIFQGQDFDQAGIQNSNGALFIIITNLSFGSIFSVCNSYCTELPVFLREHFNGIYRTDAYFLSKQIVETPLYVLEAGILFTILYWMAWLNPSADRFFIFLGISFLILQVVLSLGYFLSCVAPNADIALAIAPVMIIPMMLFGGFYLNSGSIPAWLSWVKFISWFYYGYSALMTNQWAGVQDIDCQTDPNLPPGSCITTGNGVLDKLAIDQDNFVRDILMLIVLASVLRVFAFSALCLKARRKS